MPDLVHFVCCVVNSDNTTYIIITFSSCCFVAICPDRLVVLPQAKHAKWRVVVVCILGCRHVAWLIYIYIYIYIQMANPIWAERQCAIATTCRTTLCRLVFFVSDMTARQQCDNAPSGALLCCCKQQHAAQKYSKSATIKCWSFDVPLFTLQMIIAGIRGQLLHSMSKFWMSTYLK
jgi:hypothetical protein